MRKYGIALEEIPLPLEWRRPIFFSALSRVFVLVRKGKSAGGGELLLGCWEVVEETLQFEDLHVCVCACGEGL